MASQLPSYTLEAAGLGPTFAAMTGPCVFWIWTYLDSEKWDGYPLVIGKHISGWWLLSHILSHINKYSLVIETTQLAKSSIKGPISIAMLICRCGPIDRKKNLGDVLFNFGRCSLHKMGEG